MGSYSFPSCCHVTCFFVPAASLYIVTAASLHGHLALLPAASHLSLLRPWPFSPGPCHSCSWQGLPWPIANSSGQRAALLSLSRLARWRCYPVLIEPFALASMTRALSLAFWPPCLQGELLSFCPSLQYFSSSWLCPGPSLAPFFRPDSGSFFSLLRHLSCCVVPACWLACVLP